MVPIVSAADVSVKLLNQCYKVMSVWVAGSYM